jgi:hypothetical protein
MKLTKNLLVGAITGAMCVAMGSAQAVVNIDLNEGAPSFATELEIPAIGGLDINTAPADSFIATTVGLGAGITEAGQFLFARFDIVNEGVTWADNLSTLEFELIPVVGTCDEEIAIFQGGLAGGNFVIISLSCPLGVADQGDALVFGAGLNSVAVNVENQNNVDIQYALYETGTAAVNQIGALKGPVTADWFNWDNGARVVQTPRISKQIDVVNPVQFTDATPVDEFTSVFTGMVIGIDPEVLVETGDPGTTADYFGPGTEFLIQNGSFDAFEGGAVFADADGGCDNQDVPAVVSAEDDTALWVLNPPAGQDPILPVGSDICVQADTTTEMVEASYDCTVTAADSANALIDLSTSPFEFPNCAQLILSGSTDRIDFVLTPNGAFKMFVRITNPSTTEGDVRVVVYNDDGDSSGPFPMALIDGIAGSTLGARASTPLVNINKVFDAAQAFDPSFDIGTSGDKLRILVRGQFGTNTVDGDQTTQVGRAQEGIYIQGLSLSLDNNSFFQTK